MSHILEVHTGYTNCGDGCCDDWFTHTTFDGETISWDYLEDGIFEKVIRKMNPDAFIGIEPESEAYYETLFELVGMDVVVIFNDTTSEDMRQHSEYMDSMYE